MYHDRVVGLINLLIPHTFKNLIRAEYLTRIGSQKIQDVKFNGGELNLLIIHHHLVIVLVDDHSLDGDLIIGLVLGRAVGI